VAPGKEVPGGIQEGIAHSGRYAVKTFGKNSYGMAIERTAGEIGVENLRAVGLSAWVYVYPTTNTIKGALVFAASNELGVNVCWKGVSLGGAEIPQGNWFKISGYFDLSDIAFKPDYKLQVYFWNDSRTDILIDDYFIVFGSPADRRGDSAHVDLTTGIPYSMEFNRPPYPVKFLTAMEPFRESPVNAGSKGGASLIAPDDRALSGRFLDPDDGNDQVLVIRPGGKADLLAICGESGSFRTIRITVPPDATRLLASTHAVKGRFLPGNTDQLLLSGKTGSILLALDGNPCAGGDDATVSLKIINRAEPGREYLVLPDAPFLLAGDFNGDLFTEILAIHQNGSWQMFQYQATTGWKSVTGKGTPAAEGWKSEGTEAGFSCGKFIPGMNRDGVLAVIRNPETKNFEYSIMHFLPGKGKFEPWFPARQHQVGKTIGPDTLKPSDRFFTGSFGPGSEHSIFRYNRDWRFDLKEIKFSDTAFRMMNNIDFSGYKRDHNPKYYEHLTLIPCRTGGTPAWFWIVSGTNKKSAQSPDLPDFIQRYSFTSKPEK
jgi:hypothetical protein